MSEEILKALVQLYAIIAKQGAGISKKDRDYIKRSFQQRLSEESVHEYMDLFDSHLSDKKASKTSVLDSVKTLSICKKINKTLTQKQKVIVLLELFELIRNAEDISKERREIINTIAAVFNIPSYEFELIEKFALKDEYDELNYPEILIAFRERPSKDYSFKYLPIDYETELPLVFVYIPSVELYFVKFNASGNLEVRLNHRLIRKKWLYLFSYGSIIKHPKGTNIYFNQVATKLGSSHEITPISFIAKNIDYNFSGNKKGLVNININEQQGKLIGIIGGSGSGKTTLLNVLSSIERPSSGTVTLNGVDIHENSKNINGAIGYVPQSDLLISELTVYENLFITAELCLGELNKKEIEERIQGLLSKLGLWHVKDLKVGSITDKKISGGQRKRLNIALELIREPMVLFLDEPTSGLSSKDSEAIIQLLKEMSSDGKLIFSVVHQPSSDIFKMFDNIMILDQGGYAIFYGNPLDSLVYFKSHTNQINSNQGYCHVCGSVNPEQLFEIIESKIVDEYGNETPERRYTPKYWHKTFAKERGHEHEKNNDEVTIPQALTLPKKTKQFRLFTLRDIKQKLRDNQYLILNFLEAPVLAFILSYVLRYASSEANGYSYRHNENIPAYLFLGVIISLFMGLSGSAEEILKDKPVRKRERLLFLSRRSYLLSKILVQFSFSAIQTFTFVLIGNAILEIDGFLLPMWGMLFSTSCMANMLGLNISSIFKRAVTIYIAIPLLLIPQMIFSGALFDFEKMNNDIKSGTNVPFVADFMASRWAYEALMVKKYKENEYESVFYKYDQAKNNASYVSNYWIPEIEKLLPHINEKQTRKIIDRELNKLNKIYPNAPEKLKNIEKVSTSEIVDFLDQMKRHAVKIYNHNEGEINNLHYKIGDKTTTELKNRYFNERLEDIVRNLSTLARIKRSSHGFQRNIDPVYYLPNPSHSLDYSAHFYAPKKFFLGRYFETYNFNLFVIWIMTLLLYITLYFNLFKKLFFLNLLKSSK